MTTITNSQSDSATEETEMVDQENTSVEKTDAETAQEQDPEVKEEPKEESFNKQSLLKDLHDERSKRRDLQTKLEEAQTQIERLGELESQLEKVSSQFKRLESVVVMAGGSLGRILDSRSFSQRIFETDDNVEDIIAEWNKANPSATHSALSSGGGSTTAGTPSMNDLLRAASK